MPYDAEMTALAKTLYEQGLLHEIQQKQSKLRNLLPTYSVKGTMRRFNRMKARNMQELTSSTAKVDATTNKFAFRWLRTKSFYDAALISQVDLVRQEDAEGVINGTINAQMFAYSRQVDKSISEGLLGTAYEGEDGLTAVSYDNDYAAIPVGYARTGAYTASALTFDKLRRIKTLFGIRGVTGMNVDAQDTASAEIVMLVTQSQIDDLLGDDKLVNGDYVNVKPIVDGKIYSALGIQLIVVLPELLPVRTSGVVVGAAAAAGSPNSCVYASGSAVTGTVRTCIAFTKQSVAFGVTEDKFTDVAQLEENHYAYQCYIRMGIGCTRIEDAGVLKVDCLEVA